MRDDRSISGERHPRTVVQRLVEAAAGRHGDRRERVVEARHVVSAAGGGSVVRWFFGSGIAVRWLSTTS